MANMLENGKPPSFPRENTALSTRRGGLFPLVYIATRWSRTRKKTSHQTGLRFATFGIAAGIVALIVVMSVMNGFQREYIDSLLETTSFHLRINAEKSAVPTLTQVLRQNAEVRSVTPFVETNLLATGFENRQTVLRVMWISPEDLAADPGFCTTLHISVNSVAKNVGDGILLGTEAARLLGLTEGTDATMRGAVVSPDEGIQQYTLKAPVSSLFRSGYYELDAGLAIISRDKITDMSTMPASLVLGLQLKKPEQVDSFIATISNLKGIKSVESWRDYNRSFFSALRTEKIVMFFLVSIIFAVVAINIHYSMRHIIARKARDLAILSACGASQRSVSTIFMLEGLLVGIMGSLLGTLVGIPVARNVDHIINAVISLIEVVISFFYRVGIAKSIPDLRLFSPTIFYIDGIPSKIFASDIVLIVAFAIIFPAIAVYSAYRKFKKASPLEVLRSE